MNHPKLAVISTDMRQVSEALCAFEYSSNGIWMAHPQRLFKPKGLMIWDAPDSSTIQIFIGVNSQLAVSADPLPARWFGHWDSFQKVAKAVSEGYEPPGWGDFQTVQIGQAIRIRMYDKDDAYKAVKVQMLMWGLTVD